MSPARHRLRLVFCSVSVIALMAATGGTAWAKSAPASLGAHAHRATVARPSVVLRGVRKATMVMHQTHTRVPTARTASSDTPQIDVNGNVLSWNPVPGADGYVFVEKVPGQPDRYQDIQGTSIHPDPVPGKMVWFSVRANVPDSQWASEVGISYSPAGTTQRGPAHGGQGVGQLPFSVGLVAGAALGTQLSYMRTLGASTARLEFDIDTPVSVVARTCAAYARAGIRPLVLASFEGRLPTPAEARNLGAWAAAVGPNGSVWGDGDSPGDSAVIDIEFGNETNFGYQFTNNSTAAFAARARTYALRFKQAEVAVKRANPGVGMLAIADTAEQGSTWISNMFKAVPDLGSRVAGWTVHPYGPDWAQRIQATISATAAAGAPARIPVWVTEWGLSSDEGHCLSDNYGFNACMTYGAAANTLESTLHGMQSRFGSRVAAFYLFQASDQRAPDASSNRESYFGALQSDGTPKGAYTAAVESALTAS